jgi:ABC-type multidrug transport system ATPase subunit
MGFVYQEDVLWMNKTVDENLKIYGSMKGMDPKLLDSRICFIKSLLELEYFSKKKAKQLSGGNKRKLCCAMALLIPPKILFLDEISNGVDPVARKNLYSYLYSLKNTATLMITHRIDEVEKICNTIGILVDGKLREVGSSNDLK